MDLTDQARWWWVGFAGFVALTVAAAVVVRRTGRPLDVVRDVDEPPPTTARRITWTLLAGIPAALLLGVTTDISTDVAAVPLLWVGPLVVYLATLIHDYARATPIGARSAAVALIPLAFAVALRKLGVIAPPIGVSIALLLATLDAAGLALHGRLAVDRPSARYLTG